MIRKINSPQGLIALSLFLGTFCAFEAVSIEKGRQQTKIVPTPPKKDTRNEDIKKNILDIKKNILDSLKEEKEAISNATETKRRVFEKIYAELRKNVDQIPAEKVKEMNSFLDKKFSQIKGFEEHLGQNQDEMRQIQGLSLSRVDPSELGDRRAAISMGAASAEDDPEGLWDEASDEVDPRAAIPMGAGSVGLGETLRAAAYAEDELGSISDEAPEKLDLQAKPYMGANSFQVWETLQAKKPAAAAAATSLSRTAKQTPSRSPLDSSEQRSSPARASTIASRESQEVPMGTSRVRSSGLSGAAASATTDREIVGGKASGRTPKVGGKASGRTPKDGESRLTSTAADQWSYEDGF